MMNLAMPPYKYTVPLPSAFVVPEKNRESDDIQNLNSMSDRNEAQPDLAYFESDGYARDQLHPGFAKKCYLNS